MHHKVHEGKSVGEIVVAEIGCFKDDCHRKRQIRTYIHYSRLIGIM